LRGRRLDKVDPRTERTLIFRNWFIDGQDGSIAIVVSNFFDAVREKWPDAWLRPGPGQILGRTTGYRALARLLGDFYLAVGGIGDVPSTEAFSRLFSNVTMSEEEFNVDIFLPGTSGQSLLYHTLREQALGQ
jgi:hypothetical protein